MFWKQYSFELSARKKLRKHSDSLHVWRKVFQSPWAEMLKALKLHCFFCCFFFPHSFYPLDPEFFGCASATSSSSGRTQKPSGRSRRTSQWCTQTSKGSWLWAGSSCDSSSPTPAGCCGDPKSSWRSCWRSGASWPVWPAQTWVQARGRSTPSGNPHCRMGQGHCHCCWHGACAVCLYCGMGQAERHCGWFRTCSASWNQLGHMICLVIFLFAYCSGIWGKQKQRNSRETNPLGWKSA